MGLEEGARPDILPSREKVETNFSAITISGKSGTGKTASGEILAELLGISRYEKTGQRFREITGLGGGNRYISRPTQVDRDLDAWQREVLESGTRDNPVILEGRLAGFMAEGIDAVRILFTAPTDVRMKRILGRIDKERDVMVSDIERMLQMALEKNFPPETIIPLQEDLLALKSGGKTLATVTKEERGREKGDLEQWRLIHPELEGIDPFDPNDPLGAYDLIVPTGKSTAGEVSVSIYDWLKGKGYLNTNSSIVFPGIEIGQGVILLDPETERAREDLGIPKPRTIEDVEVLEDSITESRGGKIGGGNPSERIDPVL